MLTLFSQFNTSAMFVPLIALVVAIIAIGIYIFVSNREENKPGGGG